MNRWTTIPLILTLALVGAAVAQRVPQTINIQGFLTDASGGSVDGTVTIVFDLYDAAIGGSLVTSTGPMRVRVSKGVYSAELGFTSDDFAGGARFLEQTVNGEVLSPRSRMASAPYAYRAETGRSCWDLDGDDVCDPATEDVTGDSFCDAADCRGIPGPQGEPGPRGPAGAPGISCDCGATILDVSSLGAHPTSSGAMNSAAIQQAIDAASAAGGGEVRIATPGIYDLEQQGPDPFRPWNRHCLQVRSNVALRISRGVTLRLADNQQAGVPVNMLVFGNATNVFIGGGGRITGNTAGQTGWSGGYAQIGNGMIISGRDTAPTGSRNIRIADLTLDDHFSNPVNIDGGAGRARNVTLERITTYATGEGPQVISSDDVVMRGINVSDPTDVAVGDGVELANVSRFVIDGVIVTENGAGSAIDIFGCRNGTISNVVVDGWHGGITVQSSSVSTLTPNSADITVTNASLRNIGLGAGGIEVAGAGCTGLLFSDIIVEGSASGGAQIAAGPDAVPGPVTIRNSQFNNNNRGILVKSIRDLTLSGVTVNGNQLDGIRLFAGSGLVSDDQLSGVRLTDITARGNGGCGIRVAGSGGDVHYSGAITNVLVADNTACGIAIENVGTRKRFVVRDVWPEEQAGGDGSIVTGVKYLRPTSSLSTILGGTKGQQLYLLFDGNHTVTSGSGPGRLRLAGGESWVATDGDVLVLSYDELADGWREVSRSEN